MQATLCVRARVCLYVWTKIWDCDYFWHNLRSHLDPGQLASGLRGVGRFSFYSLPTPHPFFSSFGHFYFFIFFFIFPLSRFSGVYSNSPRHENKSFKSSVGLIYFNRCCENILHLLKHSLHCICPYFCVPPPPTHPSSCIRSRILRLRLCDSELTALLSSAKEKKQTIPCGNIQWLLL